MKRRDLIKYLSVAPIAGAVAGTGVPFQAEAATPAPKLRRDVAKELGLKTFINAAGTYTALTASLMHEEVMETINSASKQYMYMSEVMEKASAKIAELCRAEAALVTAGCYSANIIGACAALTGMDEAKAKMLPNVAGFDKNEVLVPRGHAYAQSLGKSGIITVFVDTIEDLQKANISKTALMFFCNESQHKNKITHAQWLDFAKKNNIPTLVDIAADIPPVTNLWKFHEMGFDMVSVSGGKGIAGPQSAGILMGKKKMLDAAKLSGFPSEGFGRGMKVNKEEILGMYMAIDKYVNMDHEKEWKMFEEQCASIVNTASKVKGVKGEVIVPETIANRVPSVLITWDPAVVNIKKSALVESLRTGSPAVEVGYAQRDYPAENVLFMRTSMLVPGEEKIVGKRVQEELSKGLVS